MRLPVVAVLLLEVGKLALDDGEHLARVGEQVLELGDELDDGAVLVLDLLALQRRQATQLHLQDGVGLHLGELELLHEVGAGYIHVGRRADGLDHLVQVVEGDLQAFQDVRPLLRPRELELRAPPDDVAPVRDVVLQHPLQAERLGLAVDQRQHVGAEARLQRGVLEQLLHHGVG